VPFSVRKFLPPFELLHLRSTAIPKSQSPEAKNKEESERSRAGGKKKAHSNANPYTLHPDPEALTLKC
jgi:hypothetical protein